MWFIKKTKECTGSFQCRFRVALQLTIVSVVATIIAVPMFFE